MRDTFREDAIYKKAQGCGQNINKSNPYNHPKFIATEITHFTPYDYVSGCLFSIHILVGVVFHPFHTQFSKFPEPK